MTVRKHNLLTLDACLDASVLIEEHPHSFTDHEKLYVLKSVGYHSIPWFAEHITSRWTEDKQTKQHFPIPDFHKELWQIIQKKQDAVCIISRGFGKTTAISKILALWLLLYEQEKSIMLITAKGLGEDIIGDIRYELETNVHLQSIYGVMVPKLDITQRTTERWRQRQLQLLNGTEIYTVTKGESVRGRRPTKIIIDDPQETKDIENPLIADKFTNWIFTSVYPALNQGGSLAILGTIISHNCFVNYVKEHAKEKSFQVVEYPAILNFNQETCTGTPLWPEKWPLEKLKELKAKIGTRQFMQEYMNQPFIMHGSQVFDDELQKNCTIKQPIFTANEVTFYVPQDALKECELSIGMDLALGGSTGDYTAIVGRTHDMKLVCQYQGHITQDRICQILDSIVNKVKDVTIVPESNNALAFLMETKHYPWRTKLYKTKVMDKITMTEKDSYGWNTNNKTKPLMITDLQHMIRDSEMYEVSSEEMTELTYYYYDEQGGMNSLAPYHDDILISDCLCIQGIKRGRVKPNIFF